MRNKPKINLYDIQVTKTTNHVLIPQKSVSKIKIVLFSVLAITTITSITQSIFAFDTKVSLADSNSQTSSISSSYRSKTSK
jgi:hypothetical protein